MFSSFRQEAAGVIVGLAALTSYFGIENAPVEKASPAVASQTLSGELDDRSLEISQITERIDEIIASDRELDQEALATLRSLRDEMQNIETAARLSAAELQERIGVTEELQAHTAKLRQETTQIAEQVAALQKHNQDLDKEISNLGSHISAAKTEAEKIAGEIPGARKAYAKLLNEETKNDEYIEALTEKRDKLKRRVENQKRQTHQPTGGEHHGGRDR